MVIYSGFSHWKWWFPIAMLVYQRVASERPQGTREFSPGLLDKSGVAVGLRFWICTEITEVFLAAQFPRDCGEDDTNKKFNL